MKQIFYSLLFLTPTFLIGSHKEAHHRIEPRIISEDELMLKDIHNPAFKDCLVEANKTLKESATFANNYWRMVNTVYNTKPSHVHNIEHVAFHTNHTTIVDFLGHAADRLEKNRIMVDSLQADIKHLKKARLDALEQFNIEKDERSELLTPTESILSLIAYDNLLQRQEGNPNNSKRLLRLAKKQLKRTETQTAAAQSEIDSELAYVQSTLSKLLESDTKKIETSVALLKGALTTLNYQQEPAFRHIAFRKLEAFHKSERNLYETIAGLHGFLATLSTLTKATHAINHDSLKTLSEQVEYEKRAVEKSLERFNKLTLEKKTLDEQCSNCGKDAHFRCSKCSEARYCSQECQRARWNIHQMVCCFDPSIVFYFSSNKLIGYTDPESPKCEVDNDSVGSSFDPNNTAQYCLNPVGKIWFLKNTQKQKMYEIVQ